MTEYELKTITETTIGGLTMSGTTYQIPIDSQGNVPSEYQYKNRIMKGGKMLVFDTEQEYLNWLEQNT